MSKSIRRQMKIDYKDYLSSDKWKDVKRRYKEKFSTNCFICDEPYKNNYAFHHVTYERLGNEDLEDIVPVCQDCHGPFTVFTLGKGRSTHLLN